MKLDDKTDGWLGDIAPQSPFCDVATIPAPSQLLPLQGLFLLRVPPSLMRPLPSCTSPPHPRRSMFVTPPVDIDLYPTCQYLTFSFFCLCVSRSSFVAIRCLIRRRLNCHECLAASKIPYKKRWALTRLLNEKFIAFPWSPSTFFQRASDTGAESRRRPDQCPTVCDSMSVHLALLPESLDTVS